MVRLGLLALGHVSLALGVIGIFLPILPTTPFVLLAAACYGKGSDRFHGWLIHHPRLGPIVRGWRERRAVPWRAKLAAAVVIVPTFTWVIATRALPLPAQVLLVAVGVSVLGFLFTRPDPGR